MTVQFLFKYSKLFGQILPWFQYCTVIKINNLQMKFPGEILIKIYLIILLAPRCLCVTLYIDRCIALILCEISSPSAYVLYTVHSRVEWSNTFCDFWNRTQCYQSGIFQKFNVKHFWSLALHARLARGTQALFFSSSKNHIYH